jgi:hypothetical protein
VDGLVTLPSKDAQPWISADHIKASFSTKKFLCTDCPLVIYECKNIHCLVNALLYNEKFRTGERENQWQILLQSSLKFLHHFHHVQLNIKLNAEFDWKRNTNRNSLHLTRAGDYDDHNEFWWTSCEACSIHAHWLFSLVSVD